MVGSDEFQFGAISAYFQGRTVFVLGRVSHSTSFFNLEVLHRKPNGWKILKIHPLKRKLIFHGFLGSILSGQISSRPDFPQMVV